MDRLSSLNLFRSRSLGLAIVLACAAFSTGAIASVDDPPLKGPKVKDQSVPGETRRFGTDQQGDRKDRTPGLQHGMFMRAVNTLKGEKVDANVRLSDEQSQRIEGIDREYRDQVKAYLAKNADEVKKLMGDLPPNERKRVREGLGRGLENAGVSPRETPKGKGRRGPAEGDASKDAAPVDPQKAAAAKARLKEIHEGAPQATEVHSKVFGVLSAEQKTAVEAALKTWREDRSAKESPAGDRKSDGPAPAAREQLREKLKDMTPEQRRDAIKKFRERRASEKDTNPAEPKK